MNKAEWNVVLLTTACLVVILAVVWMLVRQGLLKPLESAKELIGYISSGDLTHSREADADDELGQMIRQINQITSETESARSVTGEAVVISIV